MVRHVRRVAIPGVLALLIAGCGGSTAATTPTPTAAPPKPPAVDVVKGALVVVADLPGSTVGEAPTSGTIGALVDDGLVPTPCIKATGITATTRTVVGTDVSQPLKVGAKDVTEAVILESTPADTATDLGQVTTGARACPGHDEDSTAQYSDQSVTTASLTLGSWTGTRTTALDTFTSGVSTVASYVYLLGLDGGLMVVQLGVAFANVEPAAQYQQQADAIATKLVQRLGALS
jgi:predicted RecA/RadA family phage recombinase